MVWDKESLSSLLKLEKTSLIPKMGALSHVPVAGCVIGPPMQKEKLLLENEMHVYEHHLALRTLP